MYKLYVMFKKYRNYKMVNLKKKMKPTIVQYYLRKLYAQKIRSLADFMLIIENKYYKIFNINLNNFYYDKFMELIISAFNK